jgi:hypothetical protein
MQAEPDARLEALRLDDATRASARRLGERLARRVLGEIASQVDRLTATRMRMPSSSQACICRQASSRGIRLELTGTEPPLPRLVWCEADPVADASPATECGQEACR